MLAYITDIIPSLQRFSETLDFSTRISKTAWVLFDHQKEEKAVYIFRKNGQLLVSINNILTKGSWECINDSKLVIDLPENSYLFTIAFVDKEVLALSFKSSNSYVFFLSEDVFDVVTSISSLLSYLGDKYKIGSNIKSASVRVIRSKQTLPEPNLWVKQMLSPTTDTETLIETTLNWKQFCSSHSQYYPLYTYQEILKRGVEVPHKLMVSLNMYAQSMNYSSFQDMITNFFYL